MTSNPTPPEPRNRLHGTSQGKRTDFPPEKWIRSELEQFDAFDTGKIWNSNLRGKLHPFFDKKHWPDITQERFDVLEPSFQLATRLLKAAGPFLCNYLPDPIFHGKHLKRLEVNDKRSIEEIDAANAELLDIVDHVQWREARWAEPDDGESEDHLWAINHADPTSAKRILVALNGWDRLAVLAKRAGKRHRPVNISISADFADVLLTAEKGSHRYMVTAFLAATIMVHELGHTLLLHDLRYRATYYWVGDDLVSEAGVSFIAWLFGGWVPEAIAWDGGRASLKLNAGLHWVKLDREPAVEPRECYYYSIPMTYVQRIMNQSEWSRFDFRRDPCTASRKCRSELLRPKTPFKNGEHARCAVMLTKMSTSGDDIDNLGYTTNPVKWNDPNYLPVDEDWDDGSELRKSPNCNELDKVLTDPAKRSTNEPQIMGRPTPSSVARRTVRFNEIPGGYETRKEKHDFYIPQCQPKHELADGQSEGSSDTEDDEEGRFMYVNDFEYDGDATSDEDWEPPDVPGGPWKYVGQDKPDKPRDGPLIEDAEAIKAEAASRLRDAMEQIARMSSATSSKGSGTEVPRKGVPQEEISQKELAPKAVSQRRIPQKKAIEPKQVRPQPKEPLPSPKPSVEKPVSSKKPASAKKPSFSKKAPSAPKPPLSEDTEPLDSLEVENSAALGGPRSRRSRVNEPRPTKKPASTKNSASSKKPPPAKKPAASSKKPPTAKKAPFLQDTKPLDRQGVENFVAPERPKQRLPRPRIPSADMLSTVRNTRSKRKVAELDKDALDEFLAKRRRETRSNTPASVVSSSKGGKTAKVVGKVADGAVAKGGKGRGRLRK